MNDLEQYISRHKLDTVDTMNRLQSDGIVSDNCVLARDVHPTDCEYAVWWLDLKSKLPEGT